MTKELINIVFSDGDYAVFEVKRPGTLIDSYFFAGVRGHMVTKDGELVTAKTAEAMLAIARSYDEKGLCK